MTEEYILGFDCIVFTLARTGQKIDVRRKHGETHEEFSRRLEDALRQVKRVS